MLEIVIFNMGLTCMSFFRYYHLAVDPLVLAASENYYVPTHTAVHNRGTWMLIDDFLCPS